MKTSKPTIIKNAKLYLGDSEQLLKKIPSESIDMILTDPPYNIAKYSTGNINLKGRSALNNDIGEWDQKELNYKKLSKEFKRVLKPNGNIFIFTTYNQIGKWHELLDPLFDTTQLFVWHKTNPTPNIFRKGFLNSCELIICFWNKGHTWNFTNQKEMHNFLETPICMGKERLKEPKHPSQKPVKLLEHLIKIASNEQDLVLDPFMGVASTAIACENLNRNFTGIEIDQIFYDASIKRIKEHSVK